jgi:signal transduction histidine kinase
MAAQESERQRIAHELHDDLGQNLLVIKNWALMAQQDRGSQKIDVILEEISDTASQTIDEVRRIAYNLRPYQIEEIGLTRAIGGMLRRTGESTEIEIERNLDNIDGVFSPENEINLFRIIQESLSNIVRHSSASRASVAIERRDGTPSSGAVAGQPSCS